VNSEKTRKNTVCFIFKYALYLILKNNINSSTCSKSKRNRKNENIDSICTRLYLAENNPNSTGEEFDDSNFICVCTYHISRSKKTVVKSIEANMGNHIRSYGYIVVQYLITGFGHPYSNNITV